MVLASLFGRRKTDDASNFVMIVDAGSLAAYDGGQALPGRVQIEILQNLSKIAKEEEWDLEAVFIGEELRQVEHGGDFLGIKVFFAPDQAHRPQLILDRAGQAMKTGSALVVTNDPNIEERAEDVGASILRANSLKKGYDELFLVYKRPQSRLMKRRSQITQNHLQAEKDRREGGNDIGDLIDLVD